MCVGGKSVSLVNFAINIVSIPLHGRVAHPSRPLAIVVYVCHLVSLLLPVPLGSLAFYSFTLTVFHWMCPCLCAVLFGQSGVGQRLEV